MPTPLRAVIGALLIAVLGSALGLGWNVVNPRGIPLLTGPAVANGPDRPTADAPLVYDAMKSIPAADRITAEVAHGLWLDGTVKFVDARSAAEFAERRIPDARNIHEKHFGRDYVRHRKWLELRLPGDATRFPAGYPIVVYCNNRYCDEGKITFQKLRELGLRNVKLLATGLDAWVAAGHPLLVHVDGKLQERAGSGVPSAADTGLAWLPPSVAFALLLAAPWIALALLIAVSRVAPAPVGALVTTLAWLMRVSLGLVFLYAAWFKLVDPAGFAQMVFCYEMVPPALTPLFTVCLPAVEALAALGLVLGVGVRPAALILTTLLGVFMVAIFVLMIRNVNCACGCFPGKYPVAWMRLYEDAALALAGGLAIWRGGRRPALRRRRPEPPAAG